MSAYISCSLGKTARFDKSVVNKGGRNVSFHESLFEGRATDPEDVYLEWKAQIEAFLATGLSLHHLDSHHHIHGWSAIDSVIVELANEYQTTFRAAGNEKHRISG